MWKLSQKPIITSLLDDDTVVAIQDNGKGIKQIKWKDLKTMIQDIEISPIKSATYSKTTKKITLTREDDTTLEVWGDDVGIEIINSLTSDSEVNWLSAKQWKVLKSFIEQKVQKETWKELISIDILTQDKTKVKAGKIEWLGTKNKTYIQTFKTTKSFWNWNAVLLNLFPQVTIQANKQVKLDLRVPTRNDTTSRWWLYINVNAKVNGNWYNLWNCWYDGNAMQDSARSINAYTESKLYDFIGNLWLNANQSFTLQFELTARSYNGTTIVNGSHDINRTASNLWSRWTVQSWAWDQNFTTLILQELER